MNLPKGSLIITYVLLTIVFLDMAAPGYRRYLIVDQLKEGLSTAITPRPPGTAQLPANSPLSPQPESPSNPTTVGHQVSCTNPANAYTSDCVPYGQVSPVSYTQESYRGN